MWRCPTRPTLAKRARIENNANESDSVVIWIRGKFRTAAAAVRLELRAICANGNRLPLTVCIWRERMKWTASEQHVVHQHMYKQNERTRERVLFTPIWHQPCSNFSRTCSPIWRHHSLSAAATAGWLVEWTFSRRRKERPTNLSEFRNMMCALVHIHAYPKNFFAGALQSVRFGRQHIAANVLGWNLLSTSEGKQTLAEHGTPNRKKLTKPWKNEREKKQINFHLLINNKYDNDITLGRRKWVAAAMPSKWIMCVLFGYHL